MRRFLLLVLVGLVTFAQAPAFEDAVADPEQVARYAEYLQEFEALCRADDTALWGIDLHGPMMFVDPATRMAYANTPDADGILEPHNGVFVGVLPDDVGIANTAFEWGGTRWTMIMVWSLGSDPTSRQQLMAHEAFHRVQPELGLAVYDEMNAHLDTADGRLWMQLEWNALQKALLETGAARTDAIADALTFRTKRRNQFPVAADRERALEIFEGLAEYTGMRLAGLSSAQVVEEVAGKRGRETGFVRSFAYVSGPLYGFLLDDSNVDWRRGLSASADIGELLGKNFGVASRPLATVDERAALHGGAELHDAERTRAKEREERLAAWRKTLVDGPVLIVDLNLVTSGTFDPRKVFPFAEQQTVYTSRGLIAEWGVLTIESGAILEDSRAARAYVSLSGATGDYASGDGWTLSLAAGWKVVPAERRGDVIVTKN